MNSYSALLMACFLPNQTRKRRQQNQEQLENLTKLACIIHCWSVPILFWKTIEGAQKLLSGTFLSDTNTIYNQWVQGVREWSLWRDTICHPASNGLSANNFILVITFHRVLGVLVGLNGIVTSAQPIYPTLIFAAFVILCLNTLKDYLMAKSVFTVFRFWSLRCTNGPNSQLKWKLRYRS